MLAVTATAIGFAFDAGGSDRELSTVFAVCYVIGCVVAVLAVRQSGVFTAVIQPPLILFVAVPGSYFLFRGGQLGGLKDLAINCGYPLIERFPLMLFTAAAVLLIGLARWYFGLATRNTADPAKPASEGKPTAASTRTGLVAVVTSKISGLVVRKPPSRRSAAETDLDDAPPRPRKRPAERTERPDRPVRRRPASATAAARGERRPTKRTPPPPRQRPRRPLDDEFGEPLAERPRRPRPPRDAEPAEPRRRVRTQPPEPRKQPPPERRAPVGDRPQRRRRFDDYKPFEDPYDAPPRTSNGRNAGPAAERSTHHPVSRVRYRSTEGADDVEPPRRRPRPRPAATEYDG